LNLVLRVCQPPYEGLARWLSEEIIEPVRAAVGG
jgi:hypothetical protein